MRKIELYAINHDMPGYKPSPYGGISKEFICGLDDRSGDGIPDLQTYADMRAPYWIWRNRADLDIIGFHGYRKFLDFNSQRKPYWYEVPLDEFQAYQKWLSEYSGRYIQELLAQYDMIVAPAFDCSYNVNMAEDFRRSRSPADWGVVEDVLGGEAQWKLFDFHTSFIRPMHFVTRAPVFYRFMDWWWPCAEEIRSRIRSLDARDAAYLHRPMAYISERMYSLWLDQSRLTFIEVPLMICWGAK